MYISKKKLIEYIDTRIKLIEEYKERGYITLANWEAREAYGVIHFAWITDIIDEKTRNNLCDKVTPYLTYNSCE